MSKIESRVGEGTPSAAGFEIAGRDAETHTTPAPVTQSVAPDNKPNVHQGDLRNLHPALVKRLVPLPNWVVWKYQLSETGNWTKVPYQPQAPNRKAATNDKRTWGTYEQAVAVVEAGKADGIGFVLYETNICAFDLDNCRDAITGKIDPVAAALMARCGATYFEETVGGRGLRCIGLGGTKKVHRKQKIVGSNVSVESYRWCERYITISGKVLDSVKPNMADLGNIDAVITDVVNELEHQDNATVSSETTAATNGKASSAAESSDRSRYFLEFSLPFELMALIEDGAPIGGRSDGFFHCVKWLKDLTWPLDDIIALLGRYPEGIAAKYAAGNRVAAEARRAYGKPDHAPVEVDDIATREAKAKPKLILTSEEFTRGFVPPDYLWDGILLRGFVYALTARTGDGKTAVMLLLSAAVARGGMFAGREVAQGSVLYFAGENPDDCRMRWIAMAEHLDFDADTIDVHFIPGTFDIAKLEARIRQEVAAIDGVVLVIVDTSPAYFQGDAENDNVQMIDHAEMLRRLKDLSGTPTVVAACHSVKNAGNDNLVPRGGGGFLNAMDGNLCGHKTDMLVTLHHQGKFRGVDFEPMSFELISVTARKLIDSKGRHIPTVIAKALSQDDQRQKTSELRADEDTILILLLKWTGSMSYTDIAKELRWFAGKDEHPNKPRVQRLMRELTSGAKDKRLVEVDRDGAKLTKAGRAAAEKVAAERAGAKTRR